ncbi:MAG: Kelch repeat-containing protein [archaeon]
MLLCPFLFSSFFVSVGYAAEGSWYVRQQMPTARSGLGVAVVDGKIYAIDGNNYLTYYNVTEMYDPDFNIWVTKASMPTARTNFGIAVVDNKIYVIGGGETKINEVYDPQMDTWETKTPMNIGRSGLSASVVDGKIYVIGGNRGNPSRGVSATEVYDPTTDTWSIAKQIPIAVTAHASAVVDDKIYIIGGSLELTHNQIFDPKTNTWTTGASLPTGVDSAAAGAIPDSSGAQKIYVIGGKISLDAVNLNQIYDPQTDTWTTGNKMPTSRYALGVAVLNNTLYAIGGREGWFGSPVSAATEKYVIHTTNLFPWTILGILILIIVAVTITKKLIYKKRFSKKLRS